MDFSVFADAYSHNRRTLDHLVNLLRNRVDRAGGFSLFLGAGASVSSGVRSGGAMMEEWRRRLYAAERPDQRYEAWLAAQEWYLRDEEYSYLFERLYDQPSQRRAFIEREVAGARPSWGYAYLVSLLENGFFDTIFTTNFDDLVNEACHLFGEAVRPLVCAHDSAVSSVRVLSERPKVLKLHGDFLYDSIKNTSSELQSLETNMREKIAEFSRDYGMVVAGYSGADKSVMDLLDVLVRAPHHFRNGIYWLVHKGSTPGPRLRQLLRHDRVFWIESDGFDESMARIADGVDLGMPEGVSAPHIVGIRRIGHLLDRESPMGIVREDQSRLRETLARVGRAYAATGIPTRGLPGAAEKTPNFIEDLETTGMMWIKGQTASEEGRFLEAAECYRKVRERATDSGEREGALWDELECLLRLPDQRPAIRGALAALGTNLDSNSGHCIPRSYFLLHINEAESALRVADRAIELNPARAQAWVNRGVALLQLGRVDEVKACVDWLNAPGADPQHQAAGWALVGDYERMMACLERAIILKKYGLESAVRDVVFRPYWGIPEFAGQLALFQRWSKAPPASPYSDGLTEAEVELQTRTRAFLAKQAKNEAGEEPVSVLKPKKRPAKGATQKSGRVTKAPSSTG